MNLVKAILFITLVSTCQMATTAFPSPDKNADVQSVSSEHLSESLQVRHVNKSPIRAKREGFVDLGGIPDMMRGMLSSFNRGLSSMMGHSQAIAHHMVHGLMQAAPQTINSGYYQPAKPAIQKPYKKPHIHYGSWTPIVSSQPSYNKPEPSYTPPVHETPIQYVPARPKPTYVKPKPVYTQVKPQGSYSPPTEDSYGSPIAPPVAPPSTNYPPAPNPVSVTYPAPPPASSYPAPQRPVSTSNPAPQKPASASYPTPPQIPVSTSFPAPPKPASTSYPASQPAPVSTSYPAPIPPANTGYPEPPSSSGSLNPFISGGYIVPFQTTFKPQDPISNFNTPSSIGDPLIGTFESQPSDVSIEVDNNSVEEYSENLGHVEPILKNTLFYKDTKKIKFHQKDDGKPHDKDAVISAGKFDFPEGEEKHHTKKSVPNSQHIVPRHKHKGHTRKRKRFPNFFKELFF